jgi:hypothetical protein
MNTQSIWKNESGALETACNAFKTSEIIIKNIRDSCYNIDELQKIATAVEVMIEDIETTDLMQQPQKASALHAGDLPTLQQLITQTGKILV